MRVSTIHVPSLKLDSDVLPSQQLKSHRQDVEAPMNPFDGAKPEAAPTGFPLPPPPLTPEQFAALPHHDSGPRLLTTIWILTGLATVFLTLRLYCKWLRHRGLWWDDWMLIASWMCITAECCLLTFAVSLGFGKYLWDYPTDTGHEKKLMPVINSVGTLTLTAAIWSKTSFAFTLLRLSEGIMKWSVWFIIVSMNIAMGLSAVFIWVHCDPPAKTWNFLLPGECWDPRIVINYDIFSAAYSAAMDITLALLPWKVIWGLQMQRKEKLGVALAMSCGIFAGITAIIKTIKIPNVISIHPGEIVDLFVWGNAETCVTIVAASIPVLRVLIREARTSARRYRISGGPEDGTCGTCPGGSNISARRVDGKQSSTNTCTVSAGRTNKTTDDCSDRSILNGTQTPGHIMQVSEIAIEFENRRDPGSGFEMGHLSRGGSR